MIQANDLRIGNFIVDPEFSLIPSTVSEIQKDGFIVTNYNDHLTNKKAEPLILTPEILEKCGFVFINHTFYTKDNIVSFAVFNNNLSTTYVCGDNQINKIEYLHQLQNLYYSLVGGELNVVW